MGTVPENSAYIQLVDKLKKEISEGLEKAQNAYNREKVFTYWRVGETIVKYLLSHQRADYGKQIFKNLSLDLNIGERILYKTTEFYKKYPSLPKKANLKWTHYLLLMSVKDEEKRNLLEDKASRDNWSKNTLQENIDEEQTEYEPVRPKKKRKKLSFARGKLYTYKIFKANFTNEMLVDLGFNTFKETELKTFKGKFVEVLKLGERYKFKPCDAKRKHRFTYKAFVEEVIDGDTLWVNIDCGFKIWLRQKVRFRGIDTPDIETKAGRKATKFVQDKIGNLPFVIIKSHGRDKYDRHLVDLFYLSGEKDPQAVLLKGNFLNQELVNEGLAEVF